MIAVMMIAVMRIGVIHARLQDRTHVNLPARLKDQTHVSLPALRDRNPEQGFRADVQIWKELADARKSLCKQAFFLCDFA